MTMQIYSAEWCDRAETISDFLQQMLAIHGGEHRFAFTMLCTSYLIKLDAAAVDAALRSLLESKDGPLCYGLIYQEVRRVCAEQGLPDPDGPKTSPDALLLEWPISNARIN